MKNYFKHLKLSYLALIIFTTLSNCASDDDYNNGEALTFKIQIANNTLHGNILVNNDNQSMYFFAGDVRGSSTCAGECAINWPPVIKNGLALELGANLDSNDFGTIVRSNGDEQFTYKGWPLYYFSIDIDGNLEAPGQTLGDGAGNSFYIAKPDYSLFFGKQVVNEDEPSLLYLVDKNGVTLYFTTADDLDTSNCSGGCAGVWPPFNLPENLVLPSLYIPEHFGVIQRNDELGPQLSFMGSPLYRFSQDEGVRGNTLGQAGGPGANFFVVEAVQ